MEYPFKTKPLAHQLDLWNRTRELAAWAVHDEQGTGKTKVMIDTAAWLYMCGKIDAVLVLAPNGVHTNWIKDEIPTHLPDDLMKKSSLMWYRTQSSGTMWHRSEVKAALHHSGLSWMAMTYDSIMTLAGKEAALKFLDQRRVMFICDESTQIKSPGAKRTKRVVAYGAKAKCRRTMTGTPVPNGAFDIYSQIKFLDENFWKRERMDSFAMFKSYFGVFERKFTADTSFEKLVAFKNLEELNHMLAKISSRVTKAQVLDLPPKVYQTRYFELGKEQRRIYNEIRDEFMTLLASGQVITANLVMVRMLRLQQISCGYLPVGEGEPAHIIEGGNPRLEALAESMEGAEGKKIIWARFTMDIDQIMDLAGRMDVKAVRYDGRVKNDEDLLKAKNDFQHGDADWFVSNPAMGAEGLTLHAANKELYYSNSFNLRHRLQSEDRAHRIGQHWPVTITDILGEKTIDRPILRNLGNKISVADVINGDQPAPGGDLRSQLKSWLDE